MAKEMLHMWQYWEEKKGLEVALDEYYPNTVKNDPQLTAAYVQYKNAKLLIETIMAKKAGAEENENV